MTNLEKPISTFVPTPEPSPDTSFETFKSSEQGFSISLPKNWHFHASDPIRDAWISYPVDSPSSQGADSGVIANIFTSTYTPEGSLQGDLVSRSFIGSPQSEKKLYNANKSENITIGGQIGLFAVSEDQKYAIVLVDNNGKRYVFTLGTTDISLISVFRQILSTIKFI